MDAQAKNDYGIKVAMFIENPKYMGTISEEEAKELGATVFSYSYGSEALGYQLTLHWAINTHEDTIVLARYSYEGVASGIAVNHMLCILFSNKNMPEVESITYPALERLLRDNPTIEALPASESYAITFALDATKLAVKKYINSPLNHDEKTLPCTDSPMSIASIKKSIRTHNILTLESLSNHTKAGSSNESCKEKLLVFIEENKIQDAHNKIIKAQRIINELMVTLDFEAGGEIAQNLYNLYDFIMNELIKANIKKEKEGLYNSIEVMQELLDAWRIVIKEAQANAQKQSKDVSINFSS